jgi:pimeloyl-ACP methyl ester carboxylesterase
MTGRLMRRPPSPGSQTGPPAFPSRSSDTARAPGTPRSSPLTPKWPEWVLLSAAARPGGDILVWQAEHLATRLPLPVKLVLRVLRTNVHRLQRSNLERIAASGDAEMRLQGQRVNARWTCDFVAHDPAPALARIAAPVLSITGGGDLQVPPEDVDAIGRLVRGPFQGHVVADLNHLFRPDPRSLGPTGYRGITARRGSEVLPRRSTEPPRTR